MSIKWVKSTLNLRIDALVRGHFQRKLLEALHRPKVPGNAVVVQLCRRGESLALELP